jgi:molybdopterin-guanine dinucleotide biosynthesis protein A
VADRVGARLAPPVTGVLLVGGASKRFGSPKALARFRGETLAERGWRLLHEVCEEVLAVGKARDELPLPVRVVDDGADDRAPIYGLIAGLRAASHERCLFLPVDCPLVSPDVLRALAREGAVPQTGPLPGAYERAHLSQLEARVARGELSLKGVNPTVVQVDERQLLNVNTRMDLIEAAVADWARARDDVKAALVIGSRARSETPADRWSDLDVVLVVDDPDEYLAYPGWLAEFGEPVLTFVEETPAGERERRVLYEGGEDVDFPIVPVAALDGLEHREDVRTIFARGYRMLVDKIGVAAQLSAAADVPALPAERDLGELAADFWYHALWSAKKLRRGEVFTAKGCIDGYMKWRLVTLLEWHAKALDPKVDAWHEGRFLERWADAGALAVLEDAYARYDIRDVARALWATIDLWQGLEEETARRLGYAVELDYADLRRRIAEVVPDPRR